jgi:hypothetical protein
MQSADQRELDYLTVIRSFDRTRNRAVTFQCPVGSMVVTDHLFPDHPMEMPFAQDDHLIQTFPAQ